MRIDEAGFKLQMESQTTVLGADIYITIFEYIQENIEAVVDSGLISG